MGVSDIRLSGVSLVKDRTILQDIDLELSPGIHCLLGPNGSGKTMTNRILALLDEATSGHMTWDSKPINPFTPERLSYIRKIGFMMQQPVFLRQSVRNNIRLPLAFRGVSETEEQISDVLKEFQLEELADRATHKLSKGQQQRVALARTMICDPELIILDEPTASLDMKTTKWFETYIRNLRETTSKIIIWTTHDQFQVKRLADSISVIIDGELRSSGGINAITEPEDEIVARYVHGELI